MKKQLKPCPFCGGEASPNGVVRRSSSEDLRWADGSECFEAFHCNCMVCGVGNGGIAGGYQTKDEAIMRWNTRADPTRQTLVKALKWIRVRIASVPIKQTNLLEESILAHINDTLKEAGDR